MNSLHHPGFSVPRFGRFGSGLMVLSLLCLSTIAVSAQQKKGDTIPRDRLVTTAELFQQLDGGIAALNDAKQQLGQRDTIGAVTLLTEYFRTRTQPRYFFTLKDVPQRLADFRSRYPDQIRKILFQANDFIKTYGSDVDWKMPGNDLLGRAHTPNTVRFLARQWQAENITLAYYLNNEDPASLQFLRAHIQDFIRDYESGNTETGANDIFERFYGGHRLRNWLLMHHLLLASPSYTPDDHLTMIKLFLLHGARLMDVSEKFNWGNHQLVGLIALFEASLMYPEFPVMREWNRKALRTIEEHLDKEIPPDGFQVERASHYFKLDIMNYFRIYQLMQVNGLALPRLLKERFPTMFEAMVAVAMPNNQMPVLQDAQSRTQAASNDMAELSEPTEDEYLSIGATLFENSAYKYFSARKLPPSLYWFFEPAAIQRFEALPATRPTIGSLELPQTRYYVMRSGWERDDRYLIIDAGLAKDKPDHTHGGILGVIGYAFGSEVLPNYHVRYSDSTYPVMKNSLVKNVALVDDLLQGREWLPNKARTGFGRWNILPVPTVTQWLSGSSVDYLTATHNGFEHVGVSYSRSVLFLKPMAWLVIDRFSGDRPHSYKQLWQGEFTVSQLNGWAEKTNSRARLRILQAEPESASASLQSTASLPRLQYSTLPMREYSFHTLLYPDRPSEKTVPQIQRDTTRIQSEISARIGDHEWRVLENKGKGIREDHVNADGRMIILHSVRESLTDVVCEETQSLVVGTTTLRLEHPVSFELHCAGDVIHSVQLLKGAAVQIQVQRGSLAPQTIFLEPGKLVVLRTE